MNTKKLFIANNLTSLMPPTSMNKLKCALYRWAGVKIEKNTTICSSVKIYGEMELNIGNHCFLGHECMIMGNKGSKVVLEDHTSIGSRVTIVTGFHKIDPHGDSIEVKGKEGGTTSIIRFKRGCAVSTNATILPGKVIGEMAHVAACSVVTKDVPPFTRVAGVPARVIKNFLENEKK